MIINLPKLGAVQFPDNLSPAQVEALVGRLAEKYEFTLPKPDIGMGEIAKRGFMRGLGEIGIAAGDVLPAMVGSAIGEEDYAKRQLKEAEESRAKLEREYPTRFRSYKDIASPFEALEYAAETAGELAPTVATSIIPGVGGGALGGRLAGQAALRAAQAAGPASRAALAGVETAAQVGSRRGMYGGVFLGSYAQNAPEIFEGIYQETGTLDSGIAALTGGISAVLDSVLPAKILDTLGGYGKLKLVEELAKKSGAAPVAWKTIGAEATKAAGSEGLTEAAQEAIGVYAQKLAGSTESLLSPENIQRYKESFVKGAVGGGMFGTPGGVARYAQERSEFRRQQTPEAAPAAPAEAEAPGTPALPAPEERLLLGMEPAKLPAPEVAEPTVVDAAPQQPQAIDAPFLKSLGINPRSKAAQSLIGVDLSTPEGVSAFIKTLEDPAFMGKINEAAYDELVAKLNPEQVATARTEIQGAPSVSTAKPVKQPSGASTGVAGGSAADTAAAATGEPESTGVVSPATDAGLPAGREAEQPAPVNRASEILQRAEQVQRDSEELLGVATSLYQTGVTDPKELAAELGIELYRAEALIKQVKEFGSELDLEQEPDIPESAYVDSPADRTTVTALDRKNVTPQEKDARAYFGRMDTETALRSIANDLVYQPTAYRNAKMKAFEGTAEGAEPLFATEKEAEMFRGQGGVHAKNAAEWARANLSPENVAYLDKWVAQYTKEAEKSAKFRKKLDTQQEARKNTKKQVSAEQAKAETADRDALSDLEADRKEFGIKAKPKTRRQARKLAEQAIREFGDLGDDMMSITASDLDALLASPEIATLSTELHPAVTAALRQGNLVSALKLFADSIDQPRLAKIADTLASVLGDVKVVYGAEKAMYDPKTNTIYLPNGATDYELMHEASHAGLSHVIENPSHPVTKQLARIFEQVKADIDGAYGAKNLQEFVAELWSNESFRNTLKEKRSEVPAMSLWDKIVRLMRRVLRMPERTEATLDQVDRLLDAIVSPPPETRTGDSLYAQAIHDSNVASDIFRKLGEATQAQTRMSPEQAARFLGMVETTGMGLRRAMQKFLNLSAVGEVGARVLGRDATEFADNVNEMAGYRENLIERLTPLDKRLQEYTTDPEFTKWTKMVHDHTREDVNPEAPASKYVGSPEKMAMHKKFQQEFNSLTPKGKQLYRDLFGSYKKLFKELQDSLYSNLVGVHAEGTAERKQALGAYEKVISMIISKGVDHYAPLYRQGNFWLQYKNKDGELVRELYDTQIERASARARLESEGNTDFDEYVKGDIQLARSAPSGTIAAQIIKIMKDGGADQSSVDRFLELIVSAMPETSVLKSFTARKGTLGYEENAATAFRNVTNNLVGQLSRMRYSDKLQRNLMNMRETMQKMRGPEAANAFDIINELEARYQFAMKPTVEAWARWASGGAFYFNLAGNISSATVNLLQTPMVVLPQLGGTYGFREAAKALMAATRLYSGSGFSRTVTDINGQQTTEQAMLSVENLVNSGKAPQYEALVKRLKDLGFLQTSTARDALEASNMPGADPSRLKTLGEKTALYSAFLFHHAERMNREVTAVAAYDLEMARLKKRGVTGDAAVQQAIEKAVRMVEYTHGAGHAESAPSIGQSGIGKVLTVFKRFAFTMYYMLFDTIRRSLPVGPNATSEEVEMVKAARRQLVGIYGMSALFAGVKGVPLYWIAETAYNAFADDDEDQFDEVMRRYLGEFLFKGPVNYLTNLSIADRVGWTDLIYRDQKGDKADASVLSQFLENILGAPYAIVNNVFRGQELIAEGQFYRGVETMLPVALKNPLKAYRYATEDATTLRGDLVGEVNGYNAAMQVLGFAPADLLTKYEANAYAKSKEDATVGQVKRLLKQYYVAYNMGDQERMDALAEKLFALGDKHPDLGISDDTISRSVRARDAISRDMYQGIQIDKRMRNEIIEAMEDTF
jgi:hypothetical protein